MAEVQNNEYLLNESLSPPHFKLLSIKCEMKCQSTANEIVLCLEDGQSDVRISTRFIDFFFRFFDSTIASRLWTVYRFNLNRVKHVHLASCCSKHGLRVKITELRTEMTSICRRGMIQTGLNA